jgi:hypothetical protein
MATCPAVFIWQDSFNGLLLLLMLLSPIIVFFLFFKNIKIYKHEILLILFLLTAFLFPSLFKYDTLRWTTILYTTMYCITFMMYIRLLEKSSISISQYLSLIKFLIYAYFTVLLIQQLCVLTGLPIVLENAYNPLEQWKLNSLSLEPSHSARFMPLLMYTFITVKEIILNRRYDLKKDLKTDKYIWIAFSYSMVTMGSGTAFLFIPIVLLKFIRGKNIFALFFLTLVLWIAAQYISPQTMKRTTDTFWAVLTFDENKIIDADGSTSMRIIPLMIVVKNIGLTTHDDLFGHGIDSTNNLLFSRVPSLIEKTTGGGLFQIWYEYGFISFILFFLFSMLTCYKKGDFLSFIFWFFLIFMYGVNSQIVWSCIIILYTNKIFAKQKKQQFI